MSPVPFTSPLMIETVAIESSSLAKVAYHRQQTILQVDFRDGTIYHYLGVPIQTYRDLLQADSKGAYFNHYIRSHFLHVRLPATAPICSTKTKPVGSIDPPEAV
jgi:KTSC domain